MMNPELIDMADGSSSIGLPKQRDKTQAHQRLALLKSMAASIQGRKHVPANRHLLQSCDPNNPTTARAATNIATWREYLPEACVTAMINDGWHWST